MKIGSASVGAISVTGTNFELKNKKKYALGGMMNPEEARMNRALL